MKEAGHFVLLTISNSEALVVRSSDYFRYILPLINTLNHPIKVSAVSIATHSSEDGTCKASLHGADVDSWVLDRPLQVFLAKKESRR